MILTNHRNAATFSDMVTVAAPFADPAPIGDMAAVGDMVMFTVTYETDAFYPGQYICTLRCE